MNRGLLELYWRLPGPLRSLAAGLQGWRLAARRYGPETEALVAAALEAEREDPVSRAAREEDRLAEALWRASRCVPYYRELWARRRARGVRESVERLESWPLLSKQAVRARPEAFVAEDAWARSLSIERTSGSTGTPLKLYRSRRTLRARYALYEARHRGWYGVSRHDRWAMLGGRLVAPPAAQAPPYWVWNRPMRQLYVSSYHLLPPQARESAREVARRGCRYLWGYPSSLAEIARAALADALRLELQVVVANAEPLSGAQRALIEAAFRAPCRETYGMVELVAGAGECEAGRLHLFPELGRVEILEGGREAERGEIVATSLLDADMPLIRYRTGDRGGPIVQQSCACGRTLPTLGPVEGRCDDLLRGRDGRPIGRLDPAFKDDLPIRECQIVQESLGRARVLVAPEKGFDEAARRRLVRALRDRLGDLDVEIETVERIPRGANGKFRACISKVPAGPGPAKEAACSSRS
jgi:phenylacetate-CoA ligase